MQKPKLSVVIPIYNEEDNIAPLYKQLKISLQTLRTSHEIITVDDGSTDKGLHALKALAKRDRKLRVIVFRRNFGQSAALSAGIAHALGETIITMDADLQNDAADITRLLKKKSEGYDVVSGWRYERDDPLSKKIPSKFSNWLHKKLTGLDIHDSGCTLKAYSKESVAGLELYGEMHRYIPALLSAKGFRIGEVKVSHHKRKHGISKYGAGRLIRGFLDMLFIHFMTKYSSRPLHFFGYLGVVPIVLGVIIGIYKAIDQAMLYLAGGEVVASPLLLLSVFLVLIGVLFIIFGFHAELIIRLQFAASKTKSYSIKEIV